MVFKCAPVFVILLDELSEARFGRIWTGQFRTHFEARSAGFSGQLSILAHKIAIVL